MTDAPFYISRKKEMGEKFCLNLECSEVAKFAAFRNEKKSNRKSEKPKVKFTVLAEIAEIDYQGQFTFSSLFAPSLSTCQP